MAKNRIKLIIIALLIFLIPLFSYSDVSAQGEDPLWEYAIDYCNFLDHWWEPSSYPDLDPASPIYYGSLSLGGIGFTFNLDYIEPGSIWNVNFNDQFELASEVDDEGKAFVYFGLWSYGDYYYNSTFLSPSSETMHGPAGTITVGDPENLDCSRANLSAYTYPPTATPDTNPATNTPAPTPELYSEDPVDGIDSNQNLNQLESEISFFSQIFNYIISSWYLLLCCIILIILILLGIVVIVIRRRRPDIYERLPKKLKF